jgi:hypothetical protein
MRLAAATELIKLPLMCDEVSDDAVVFLRFRLTRVFVEESPSNLYYN